jgi:adenosine deaminase
MPPAQQAILAGAAAAQKDCGIRGRLVPSIDREAPAEAAVQMVQWMLDNRHDDVPGIGIDYRENERPPELFVEAYALARRTASRPRPMPANSACPGTICKQPSRRSRWTASIMATPSSTT